MKHQNQDDYIYSIDPYLEFKKSKKKGAKKAFKAIGTVALALVISLSSVGGYIWYDNNYGQQPESIASPTPTATQVENRVYYELSTEESALTLPQVFQKAAPWVTYIEVQVEVPSNGFYAAQYGSGTGTGIVMTEDGYIMTNHHVVEDGTTFHVTTHDGVRYEAELVGSDPSTDIAVLKIDATGLDAAEFGDSSEIIVGEPAIVIGNPLGETFWQSMTEGIISATERTIESEGYIMSLIQTSAAVNPGNSGGPMINSRGQVIGVINSKIGAEDVEGIGFAIPVNTALRVAQDLIDTGYVSSRPMLGITVQSITAEQAAAYGLDSSDVGITVQEVQEGSAAELGGMKIGDKIVAIGGIEVESSAEFIYEKDKYSVGDTAIVTVIRDGQSLDLSITLQGSTQAQ